MIRHSIEARPNFSERLAWFGIGYAAPANRVGWNETVCYEMRQDEADTIYQLTNELYLLMIDATDRFFEKDIYHDFGYSIEQTRTLLSSWENGDYLPTLFTCFDFEWCENSTPQLVGVAGQTPELLLESAVAQWDWARDRVPWALQFNTIEERLLALWKEYRYAGRTIHLGYAAGEITQFLTAEYLQRVAQYAGVETVILSYCEITHDPATDKYFDRSGRQIDLLINLGQPDKIAGKALSEVYRCSEVCLCEPFWKTLWSHPQWVSYLKENFPHPAIRQQFRPGSVIDKRVTYASWIVAGQACGVGITEHTQRDDHDVVQFIPHLLAS